jgi:hypothetical protein
MGVCWSRETAHPHFTAISCLTYRTIPADCVNKYPVNWTSNQWLDRKCTYITPQYPRAMQDAATDMCQQLSPVSRTERAAEGPLHMFYTGQ